MSYTARPSRIGNVRQLALPTSYGAQQRSIGDLVRRSSRFPCQCSNVHCKCSVNCSCGCRWGRPCTCAGCVPIEQQHNQVQRAADALGCETCASGYRAPTYGAQHPSNRQAPDAQPVIVDLGEQPENAAEVLTCSSCRTGDTTRTSFRQR